MLRGKYIVLRKVEHSDLACLLEWENDPRNWFVSGTKEAFTVEQMSAFIENQKRGATPDQERWMICEVESGRPIGTLDLFEMNQDHGWAGIGILIADSEDRGKGHAAAAIRLMCSYLREQTPYYNLFCNIQANNLASIALFEKLGFVKSGIRKDWYLHNGKRIDEYQYQLCLRK